MKTNFLISAFICSLYFSAFAQTDYSETELASNSSRKESQRLYESASNMMDKGLYDRTENLVSEAIELYPYNTEAWNLRAMCRERLNRPEDAIQDYEMLIKLDPSRYDALFSQSVLYYEIKRYPLAIEGFDRLLQIPKNETTAVFFKGTNYNNSAQTQFDRIITLEKQDAEIYHYRGLAKMALKYRDGALTDFNKAIELNQEEADFYVNRGLVYLDKQEMEPAIKDFQSALVINPEHSLALYNLSLAGKNHEDALKALDKVISLEDGFPSAYANRAFARLESGDYKGAIADYDTAIMLNDSQAEYYSNRGIAHKKAKHYNSAIRDFGKAIRLAPDWSKNYALRGEVYYKTAKFKEAVEDFSAAIAYDPQNGNYYYNRGLARKLSGESAGCCSDLRQAVNMGIKHASKALDAYCKEE